jgi:hypothetical protein
MAALNRKLLSDAEGIQAHSLAFLQNRSEFLLNDLSGCGRHQLSLNLNKPKFVKAGKPTKVALTGIMQNLVLVANALLRGGRN